MTLQKVKLGKVVEILSGFAFKSQHFNDSDGYPLIRIRDVERGFSQTFYAGPFSQDFIVTDGEILIGMDGNFNAARWRGGPALLNQRVCKIAPVNGDLDDSYLFHFLPSLLKKIEDATPFVTVKHLSAQDLREAYIPIPPITEQRRIATILDKADEVRAKRRESLLLSQDLAQSIFTDMFGDPVLNQRGWPRVSFESLLDGIESGWSPQCHDRPAMEDEWGVLKLGAVTQCVYKPQENKALPQDTEPNPALQVQPGDLLFSRKNTYELIAACALVTSTPKRLLLPDLIFRFRFRNGADINIRYIHSLLCHPNKRREVQKLASGTSGSMPNISKARLQKLDIELPPRSLQDEFAARISLIENAQALQAQSLQKLDGLFSSLQHRAFRGEL